MTYRSEAFPEGRFDFSNVDREMTTFRSSENEITSLVDSGCRVASVIILAIRTNRNKMCIVFFFCKSTLFFVQTLFQHWNHPTFNAINV